MNLDTRLGTTQPRDRASAFADSTWISSSRAAAVKGSVAPGDTFKFTFDLHAPSTTETYLEYWNLVEDGVAWLSDPGEGGPVDNDLEANIVVVAGVRGSLDGASCAAIAGWAQDQAEPDTVISTDLYFDAPAGSAGAGSTRITAGNSRSDLCTAIGSYVHGFSVPVPGALCDAKAHTVYAYGIAASGAGPNELLPGSPKTFTCAAPIAPLTPKTGIKLHVVSTTSFSAWSFTSLEVVGETDASVAAYPTGSPLPATPTVLIAQGAPEVWVIDGNVRRHVISPASLTDWKFSVTTSTAAKVNAYAQGADWPATAFLMQGAGEPQVYALDVAPGPRRRGGRRQGRRRGGRDDHRRQRGWPTVRARRRHVVRRRERGSGRRRRRVRGGADRPGPGLERVDAGGGGRGVRDPSTARSISRGRSGGTSALRHTGRSTGRGSRSRPPRGGLNPDGPHGAT